MPINEFKLNYLKKDKNLTNTDDLVKYIKVVIEDLKKSNDDLLKEVTLKKLSTEYNLSYDILKKQLEETEVKVEKQEIVEEIKLKKSSYTEAINNILYYMMNDSMYIKMYLKEKCPKQKRGQKKMNLDLPGDVEPYQYHALEVFMKRLQGSIKKNPEQSK